MKILPLILLLALATYSSVSAQTPAAVPAPAANPTPTPPPDPNNLAKYQAADAQLPPPTPGEKRVVFLGDSITEGWNGADFFPGKNYINRGISGQTTTQILGRFQQDVVALHPAVVVILAGTNDIAQNQGPITLEAIAANLESMAKTAKENKIQPVICSVMPAFDYPWHAGLHPDQKIPQLNNLLHAYCRQHHVLYVNYFTPMADKRSGMKKELSGDGVHPNSAGHAIMSPLAQAAIDKALKRS